LRQMAGQAIQLVIVPEPQIGYVNVDPAQLDQIFVNLVTWFVRTRHPIFATVALSDDLERS